MKRRTLLKTAVAAQVGSLAGVTLADVPKIQTLDEALLWLDRLEKAASVKSNTPWKMGAVLEHLAQSIDMSMDGFPEPKSALFQKTLGTAAFTVFKWRGRMNHGLTEPIPGAPALNQTDNFKHSAELLRVAIKRFNGHMGALKPHFAYGELSRADFALAHAFHIANHQDEIVVS